MITVTLADAKKHLAKWLEAARQGEDVAIRTGGQLVALCPVGDETAWARQEYGMSKTALAQAGARVRAAARRRKNWLTLEETFSPAELEEATAHRTRRSRKAA